MGGVIAKLVFKNGREPVASAYTSLWDIPCTTIDGLALERLGQLVEGKKAVLIVNVASK